LRFRFVIDGRDHRFVPERHVFRYRSDGQSQMSRIGSTLTALRSNPALAAAASKDPNCQDLGSL
jgi:hypothetical protein